MVDHVGQQFGNYRLLQQLGEGGFAVVYLGEHVYLKTKAAVKVLKTQLASANLDDFLKEARTVTNLDHPNIVRVSDFGLKKRIPYFIMDYAPNGTLSQRHPKGSCLMLETILLYIKEIAAALQYAHDQKLIHRDIKPVNLLIGRHDEILLSDFGIAVVAHSTLSWETQKVMGTPTYMAPEHFQSKAKPASDQYSLGIVVYEWLCGAPPFRGDFMQLAFQHNHEPPPSLCARITAISPAVEQVVLQALNKDPQQRFASVQDFATALEQAYQEERSPIKVLSVPYSPSPLKAPLSAAANQWSSWSRVSIVSPSLSSQSNITAKWRFPDHLDVIAAGNDGSMWNTTPNNGQWVPWYRIGNVSPLLSPRSSISAVSRGLNQINLFVMGIDGIIYTTWWDATLNNGQWSFWSPIESTSSFFSPRSSISAVSRGLNQIELFVMGVDGSIYTTWWDTTFNNSQWVPWSRISNILNTLSPQSSISAVSRGHNQIELFAIGVDGVYTMWWNTIPNNGHWSLWSRIGNAFPPLWPQSNITAISRGLNQIELFAMGVDSSIYATWWDATLNNSQWVPWYRVGNTLSALSPYSSITAVSHGLNQIDLFIMGNDATVYTVTWNGSGIN